MYNYHTHTYRCKHARGDVFDYAEAAVSAGLRALGMSDHIPYPDEKWNPWRMNYSDAPDYFSKIKKAQEKYKGLKIFKGIESEFVPEYRSYYKEFREQWELDYMIGAVHWFPHEREWLPMKKMDTPEKLKSFTHHIIELIESEQFLFIAHPDNFGSGYLVWDKYTEESSRAIILASREAGVPLEINGYGFRKQKIETPDGKRHQYPLEEFWKIAGEYQAPAVYNSDAHKPEDIISSFEECLEIVKRYNLQEADPLGVPCDR